MQAGTQTIEMQANRQTHRQTDKQKIERLAGKRQAGIHVASQVKKKNELITDKKSGRKEDRQTDRQVDNRMIDSRLIKRQAQRKAGRQTW